uniref:Uncharacterized protein n=1 Tax=Chromera velia CCMP2878 TaxID=1169474 RepID=A0A0G4GTJ1_9ALVE|eukprot:Cvel_5182.t1-p1 / transcript=Cvel_5182.t1 / gene=Cvel_5182 / organism=Chromera_velia_CCMP2878 / gene_product=hypothetical protein / transcript_product=hypothetical protein / location=Cvel_scaffold238:33393-34367(-) / protein_length=325 / sequence_SO=supercontig / SO=protein_coding / is_pseudo=false
MKYCSKRTGFFLCSNSSSSSSSLRASSSLSSSSSSSSSPSSLHSDHPSARPPAPPLGDSHRTASSSSAASVSARNGSDWFFIADRWSAGVAAGTEKKKQQHQEPDPPQRYWYQLWYADDASNTGWLRQLRAWLRELVKRRPAAGYVVEVDKLILAVLPQFMQKAKEIFAEFPDLQIVEGMRLLRGHVGTDAHREKWVQEKVKEWAGSVERVATVAEFAPYEAYAACLKSLQHEWKFMARVVLRAGGQMGQLEGMIRDCLIPALMKGRRNGGPPTQHDVWLRDVAAVPVRLLSLASPNPPKQRTGTTRPQPQPVKRSQRPSFEERT